MLNHLLKRYEKVYEDEVIPSTKTLYNYINQGLLEIKRIDLPRATRMKPRTKNVHLLIND